MVDSLEVLVAHIRGMSAPSSLNDLHVLLKQSEDTIRSPRFLPLIPASLHLLEPSLHSLGYLYLLQIYFSSPGRDQTIDVATYVLSFVSHCSSDQIRLAPEKFISICKILKDHLMQRKEPIRGIVPLRTAIRKLQNSAEHLTVLHSDFLLLCILAKSYKTGLSILEDDVFDVDQPKDFFLYCYYGGMIYVGLKRFPEALECFHNAVTAPMSTLNPIVVEAYKKYILVSLIQNGQVPSFPKYAPSSSQRHLKLHAQMYIDLSTSYATGNYAELETFIQSNLEKFQTDNNFGLAKQVLSSLYKRNIQRLTQTYLTLSLQDIANAAQLKTPKEAEMHVLKMIQDGEIFASINQKDGMVNFLEDPEQYKSCQMVERIDSSIRRLMTLSNKLNALDEQMACDPAYLTKSGREPAKFDFDDSEHIQTSSMVFS